MLKLVNPNPATSENVKIWRKSHLSPIHHGALHKARVKNNLKIGLKVNSAPAPQSTFMWRFYPIEWKVHQQQQKWKYNEPSWCNKWHHLKLFSDYFCQWSNEKYIFPQTDSKTIWYNMESRNQIMKNPVYIIHIHWIQSNPVHSVYSGSAKCNKWHHLKLFCGCTLLKILIKLQPWN